MNDNILRFIPKRDLTAKENLAEYISNARSELSAFDSHHWSENKWRTIFNNKEMVVRFATNLEPYNSYKFSPLSKPFLNFAKAYIKNCYTDRAVANLQRHMEALRALEEALILAYGKADILLLDGIVLARIDEVFASRFSSDSAKNKAGYQLQLILNFCRENFITPALPEWQSPYGKKADKRIKTDESGKEYRSQKLPTDEEMMLVAELFSKAPQLSVEAEYFSAIYAILMTAPSRASEQLTLPVNCLVWEEDRAGKRRLGIRWEPAKNGKAGIKWVPSSMEEVVLEAVERLKKIGEPARRAAKFAEENPGRFMVHEDCITDARFADTNALTIEQLNAALGTSYKKFNSITVNWLKNLIAKNQGVINYEMLGEFEYDTYFDKFKNWPFATTDNAVKVSELLLLHRVNEFHEKFEARPFSFTIPTVNHINDRFVQKESKGERTLWSKFGFALADGRPIELATHKARHWLSTMAESGGMHEITLANWAGRAKVSDNRHYDHRTEEQKAEQSASLMIPENANVLEKIQNRIPVTFADIGKNLDGSAIVTEMGVCEHDYAMSPCHRQGDCETCKELVCIKGFTDSLEFLKKREKEVQTQLSKALHDHEMGAFGADRWVTNHGWRLSHIRTKIRILEDENTPIGAVIRIPELYDPSPIKEVLREKGLSVEIRPPEEIDLDETMAKLMEL